MGGLSRLCRSFGSHNCSGWSKRPPRGLGTPQEVGIGDVMASGRARAHTVSRHRIQRSERAALLAAALALALGAAAWLTEVDSSASANTADVMSFEDRFVPMAARESFRI